MRRLGEAVSDEGTFGIARVLVSSLTAHCLAYIDCSSRPTVFLFVPCWAQSRQTQTPGPSSALSGRGAPCMGSLERKFLFVGGKVAFAPPVRIPGRKLRPHTQRREWRLRGPSQVVARFLPNGRSRAHGRPLPAGIRGSRGPSILSSSHWKIVHSHVQL